MGLQQDAIYGNPVMAYQTLGASMVNPANADGSTDWNAILANGIRGAAQGAIAAQVQGAYASGQLVPPPGYYQQGSGSGGGMMGLLIVAAILYAVTQ